MPSSTPGCFSFLFPAKSNAVASSQQNSKQHIAPSQSVEVVHSTRTTPPEAHSHIDPCYYPCFNAAARDVSKTHDLTLPPYTDEITLSDDVRKTIQSTISAYSDKLTKLSLYISDHPELSFEEHKAAKKITQFLEDEGFEVEGPGYKGLDTSFKATYTHGIGGRTFAFNSEYDALPGIGHACGHNLIAIGGVAATLGMREAMKKHNIDGTVVLIGTPAEEGGVAKGILVERGAFKGVDGCMMIHPIGFEANSGGVSPSLAVQTVTAEFFGRTSHAGAAPWDGINALDAVNISYTAISSLRQQIRPTDRIHGIITAGGEAPNIIPDYTAMKFYVRSTTASAVEDLVKKVVGCFEGAAKATGCTCKIELERMMYDLRNVQPFAEEYGRAMLDLYNVKVPYDKTTAEFGGSTDFGNVTYALPACHPFYGVPATPGRGNHTKEFRDRCRTPVAHEQTLNAATAMSIVGARFLVDKEFAHRSTKSWEDDMKRK